jgi:lactate permease
LPIIVGSLVVIFLVIAVSSLRKKNSSDSLQNENNIVSNKISASEIFNAFSVYFFVLIFITLVSPIFPEIKKLFDSFNSSIKFYPGDNGKTITFYWLTNPGVLILLAVTLVGVADLIKRKAGKAVFSISLLKTIKAVTKTAIILMLLVSFSTIMRYSGMIKILAEQISAATGALYPLFSPVIGALGAFITGTSISSCILFGEFQKYVAINLGVSEFWFTSANLAGATIGKILAPQNITVALAAVGLSGQESKLLHKCFFWSIFFLAILGVITFFFSDVSGRIVSLVNLLQN